MISSKKGRLYVKFLVAAAVLAVALYASSAFAVLKVNSAFKWFKRTLYQPSSLPKVASYVV